MTTQELLSRLAENVSVRRAFGTAYEKDGLLIIPVALVAGGGGGGDGTFPPPAATLPATAPGAESAARPAGSSSGGGFGGLFMPVGVYVVNGDQVRWIPAVDVTIMVLAGLGAVRLLAGLGLRARRRRLS